MAKLNVNNRTPGSLFALRQPRILPQNADHFSTVLQETWAGLFYPELEFHGRLHHDLARPVERLRGNRAGVRHFETAGNHRTSGDPGGLL